MILILFIIIFSLFISAFYSPLIAIFLSQACLITFSFFKKGRIENWFLFCGFSLLLVITYANFNNSFYLFYHSGHDFPSYYNNYLKTLERAPFIDWFTYGGGLEISLPLLNFLISVVVDSNTPYPVFYLYSLTQNALLVLLCIAIAKHENINIGNALVLLVFMFCFYRFFAGMNAIRQGYASFFILLALFSKERSTKVFFIIIACSFHITSIAVYYLCKHLFNINSKNFFSSIFYFILMVLLVVSVSALAYFYDFKIIKSKLLFLLLNFNFEVIKESVINGLKVGFMYFALFFHSIIFKDRENAPKYLFFTIIILVLSIHPTLFRFIFPLANIMLGYYYYKAAVNSKKSKRLEVYFLVFLFTAMNTYLLSKNPRYHHSYEIITTPGKMFENFKVVSDSVDRETL